jgi:DNA polymerase I-like protein with 3'-5' exonuclease and polymerase domains
MEAYALAKTLDIITERSRGACRRLLNGFPQLKEWRVNSRNQVKNHGYISNKVGRIRHLPKVKKIFEKYGDQLMDWRFRKELEQGTERKQ